MRRDPQTLPTPRPGHRVYVGAYEDDETTVYIHEDTAPRPLPGGPFAWGYQGAGPRAVARAILTMEYNEVVADVMADRLMEQVIAQLPDWRYNPTERRPGPEWELASPQIHEWFVSQARGYRQVSARRHPR